jgi:hypothetical protein
MFALVIIAEVLAFLVPLWSFHQSMQLQKAGLQGELDELAKSIPALEQELAAELPPEQVLTLKDQLEAKQQRYDAIEHMPTWPIDTNTIWKFAAGIGGQILAALIGVLISKLFS